METNITQANGYRYTTENNPQKQSLKAKQAVQKRPEAKKQNSSENPSDKTDTSYIKILIAQLAAAKTSAEASDYIVKLNIELSKLQSSNKNAILINKIKKVIQNGNKKVSQLKEEEKLESKRKSAEMKRDSETASALDATIKEKKRKRVLKENNNLPNLDESGPISLENISVSLGADFSSVMPDIDVSI